MTGLGWAAVAAVALLGPGCAQPAPAEPVATSTVDMPPSYRFEPEVIEVPAGSAVTWTNSDNFTHTVRLLDGSEVIATLEPGQQAEHRFSEPGTYRYDCSLHPNDMDGTVIVTEP